MTLNTRSLLFFIVTLSLTSLGVQPTMQVANGQQSSKSGPFRFLIGGYGEGFIYPTLIDRTCDEVS